MDDPLDVEGLIADLRDARARTLALVEGLTAEQLMGPRLSMVNPLRWEIGHAAFFHEFWTLRHLAGLDPVRPEADALFDSINIHHNERWDLPLPSLEDTLAYMAAVQERQIERLRAGPVGLESAYLHRYAVYHEDMHTEAFTYSRQTLGYPPPRLDVAGEPREEWAAGPLAGDAEIPRGTFMLGADPGGGFAFDNEKWAHPVRVAPFAIARAAVSNAEFTEFVGDGGYRRRDLWDEDGWRWREGAGLEMPVYWRRADGGGLEVRRFDRYAPLPPHAAVVHVSWYEADAYCRWAGRRLPTEAEWETAAAGEPSIHGGGVLSGSKRRFPWGEGPPSPERANLEGRSLGAVDVGALPAGDSAFGCRQMIGNVWEWTADTFEPYPGFVPDMYRDYSLPLFGDTRVLRGGAWATRARLIRTTWRNYYGPDRNDVLAGFRTCAI